VREFDIGFGHGEARRSSQRAMLTPKTTIRLDFNQSFNCKVAGRALPALSTGSGIMAVKEKHWADLA